jgi:hypothetical protein
MTRPARARRFIALFAAYVVALQALLLPLSVAVGGTLATSLCADAQTFENQPPASHPDGCPCAAGCGMQCCIHALSGPPQMTIVVVDLRAGLAPAAIGTDHAIWVPERRQPQIPRAPPAA